MALVAVSPISERQLILAKQLFSTGARSGPAPGYKLILEVVTLDLATETVLGAIASALDTARSVPTTDAP